MKLQRLFGLFLIGSVLLAGCQKAPPVAATPPAPEVDPNQRYLSHAQPRLPTIKVWLGDQELTAEIAIKDVEIFTGMMYRTNMPENEAMLFVLPRPGPQSFYMRNCFIPLSGAYINPEGEILQLIDMKPQDDTSLPSTSNNILFVLEVPHGWFDRHHVGVGALVRTERGSLQETFKKN